MKNVNSALIATFIFSSFIDYCFAAPLKDMPGSVPLQYERQASSDLVYNNKILLPDEARSMYETGKITDLSLLNPDETSVLWKNLFNPPAIDDLKELELSDGKNSAPDEVEFISEDIQPNGRIGFIAQKKSNSGLIKTYRYLIDLKGHNLLLRKNLLRKIGYQVPLFDHVHKVRVKFKGAFSKREFFKQINRKTFIESKRWVTDNSQEAEDEYLTLQDLIVFEGTDDTYYNLARGEMSEAIPQGRRLFNSVLVTSSMTDSPESVNLMSWIGGQVFNTQLYLPFEDAGAFNPNYEDVRWITRRILMLSRNDWQQIVLAAKLPTEVSLVMTEKLIARRNFLRETLSLQEGTQELSVNFKVSSGERLVEGKLISANDVSETWPGYARRFSGTDPSSPLSREELVGFFKSKTLSNTISNLLSEFNTRFIPKTDLAYKIFDHQLDVAVKNFTHTLITGEVKKTPTAFWSTPYYNSQLIVGREIITGNYLGTENIVQIADTFGFAVDGGLFYLGEGLPAKVSISGKAKLSFVKTYTHLKPLKSIKAGLKEPFRNILVPYLKNQSNGPLEEILKLEQKINVLSPEEFETQIASNLDKFNTLFGNGESLILTTSLGPDLNLRVGYDLAKNVAAFADFENKLIGVRRMQIFRKDEKTIQVYMDPATYNIFSISFGLEARIPIVEIGWSWQKGLVSTYFFNINIDPDLESNPQFFNNIQMVSAALQGATLDSLKAQQKPWQIKHDFSDRNRRFQFLYWRHLSANTTDLISVTHPEGTSQDYVRRLKGKRSGRDYQSLVLDVSNALIQAKLDPSINIASNGSGNPADTLFGKSVTRQVIVEAELTEKSVRWDNLMAKIAYHWKGWQIKKSEVEKILNEIKSLFGKDIFQRPALNETEKIQFYSIEVSISLYQRAFERILKLTEADIEQLFKHYGRGNIDTNHQGWINWIVMDLKKLHKALESKQRQQVVESLTQILEVAENQLEFEGFKAFVGGEQNLFARGVIRGFRVGAENGTQEIQSMSIGQIGSFEPSGPLQNLQSKMNVSGGEFFITWLLNPL